MKVLLSAYACEPNVGSEQGKGWDYAVELAQLGHDVTVVSCGSHHRMTVEEHLAAIGVPERLRFVWHDVPGWPGPGYVNARGIRRHYLAWQLSARGVVRDLLKRQQFDVIHHLTWTVLRWPSFLGGLGPRFVFGPVGGGATTPLRLRTSLPWRGMAVELARDLANAWARVDPLVWWSLWQADAVLVTDRATLRAVPRALRGKAVVWPDICAPSGWASCKRCRAADGLLVLSVARLEYWKGIDLGLAAFRELLLHAPSSRYTIVGSGPDAGYFRRQAEALGVTANVEWFSRVPHQQMASIYAAHDVLLFPSLHDSGPHVIGEALASGLPVVALDLGGPGVTIDRRCGVAVATNGRSRAEIVSELAAHLRQLHASPELRAHLSDGARERANELSVSQRVRDLVERHY